MDLQKMISALLARRGLVAFGVIVGLIASFMAINTVQVSGDPSKPLFSYSPRVKTVYSTTVRMILDEPNFGLGRVGKLDPEERRQDRDLSELAAVYSYLALSDELIADVSGDLKRVDGQIKAAPVEGLPIIEITVEGNDSEGIRTIASKTAENFITYFKNEQVRNEVPPADRLMVRTIGEPSPATTEQSRRAELAFAFFSLPVAGAALLAFALENLKRDRESVALSNNQPNPADQSNQPGQSSQAKAAKRTA